MESRRKAGMGHRQSLEQKRSRKQESNVTVINAQELTQHKEGGRIAACSLAAHSETVRSEVNRLAALAGINIVTGRSGTAPSAVLNLREVDGSMPQVEASFHPAYAPYFASGCIRLSLREEAEDVLELMLAAGSTQRGTIVGVIGSRGGIGVSTLASWLAREMARERETCLLDLDPLSAGIDLLLGLEGAPGLRWSDLAEDSGALVPGRLNAALPSLGALRVLSADPRGGAPRGGGLGVDAIAALSQANEVTVLDIPRSGIDAGTREREWLEWCDVVVLIVGGGLREIQQARRAISLLPGETPLVIVGSGVSGGEAAALAEALDVPQVMPLRRLRTLDQDLSHGVRVGDRTRCATARDVSRIGVICREAV
ncbi:hypothetical protein [Actinobaculum sp. 352]|uniref:hypothetical protein n=1 Tax=Actinobaculum sp. 352 TaxID=2490946 RepID=UPI000F7EB4B5|nr:hypothetical protein [Actinobaculum sp. 352]RTE49232.1 hypothetical protein EKN07_06570 [Actinobaculum sp. 352]